MNDNQIFNELEEKIKLLITALNSEKSKNINSNPTTIESEKLSMIEESIKKIATYYFLITRLRSTSRP